MQHEHQRNSEHHTMVYSGVRSDYHEFLCEMCGRHLLFHVNPSEADEATRKVVVLKQGNFWASHSGGVGGLTVNGIDVSQNGSDEQEPDWDEVKASLDDVVDEILNGEDD